MALFIGLQVAKTILHDGDDSVCVMFKQHIHERGKVENASRNERAMPTLAQPTTLENLEIAWLLFESWLFDFWSELMPGTDSIQTLS